MRKITKSCIEDTVSSTISVVFCAFMDVESMCATDFILFFFFFLGELTVWIVFIYLLENWVGLDSGRQNLETKQSNLAPCY